MLTSADVNALYPSIKLERDMTALRWFMDAHTSFNQILKDLCLKLAHSVLTNNYVECKELEGDVYHQIVSTAMGTSFSVRYAIIFMIWLYAIIFMVWLESPMIDSERFRLYVQPYKRFIDDLFLIWTGSVARLCEFRRALAMADDNISLDWTGFDLQQHSMDPGVVAACDHVQVHFLHLDMSLAQLPARGRTDTTLRVICRPYCKPGNAYAYIPFNSFHG
jgi:hypothetical protein